MRLGSNPAWISTIALLAILAQSPNGLAGVRASTTDAALRARHEGPWRTVRDPATLRPQFVYGAQIVPSSRPRQLGEFESAARTVVDDNPELFGVVARDLALLGVKELPLSRVGSSDKVAVVFQQRVDGIEVFNGTITILFDRARGSVVALETEAVPDAHDVDLTPAATTDDVWSAVAKAYQEAFDAPPTAVDSIEAVIVGPSAFFGAKSPLQARGATLAYSLSLSSPGHRSADGLPVAGRVLVSAEGDHTVFHVGARSYGIDGKAQTNVNTSFEPNTATNQELAPVKHAYVRSDSPFGPILATTDADGRYTMPQAGPVTLVMEYEGPYCRTNDATGAEHFVSIAGATGSNVDFVLNPSLTEFDTAEAAAFHWVNAFREYIVGVDPSDTTMNFTVTANVNLADMLCNAYYTGSTINFQQASPGCVNTSYQDLVHHEEGHWATDRYIAGGITGAFHEGNADSFAYFINDDPCLTSITGSSTGCERHADQTVVSKCPCDGDETCHGGSVHVEGEALASALFEVRQRLGASLGDAPGDALADALFLAWMNAFNDGQILDVIRDHWIALDDDNGTLIDGTPHLSAIDGGFAAYGWSQFPDLIITPVSVPGENAEVADSHATAIVVALDGPAVGLDLLYTTNGGPPVSVPFSPAANPGEFVALVPSLVSPATVEWYVRGTSISGYVATWPPLAPELRAVFHVGKLTPIAFWDFEAPNEEGWTEVILAGPTGAQWERGHPAGSNEPTDADQPFSGGHVWGTDISAIGFDGKYDPNSSGELRSPLIDLTRGTTVFLQYKRWLAVEQAPFDQADILVNGVPVFSSSTTCHTLDDHWVTHNIDISIAAGNPTTQIAWRMTADAALEFGGWNIDDVMVYRVAPYPNAYFAAYGTGCAGGSQNKPSLSGAGVPSPGNFVSLVIAGGKPGGVGLLAASPSQANLGLGGHCSLLVGPPIVAGGFPIALDPVGGFTAGGALPASLSAGDVYWQFLGDDAGAGSGLATSNGLRMHVQ